MKSRMGKIGSGRFGWLACAAAGLAFLPASLVPDLDPFINLAPLAALVLFIVFIAVAIWKRDRVVKVACALAFLGPASLVGPEIFSALLQERASSVGKPTLKILSVNVLSTNSNFRALMGLIETEQPDVVFVQEAFDGWSVLLGGYLKPYSFAAGCAWASDCNAAVLSKLGRTAYAAPYKSSHMTAHLVLPERFGAGTFEATSVHLSRPPPMDRQLTEVTLLEREAATFGSRAIVAGDFNATPWTNVLRRLDHSLSMTRATRLMPSWPSVWPMTPVDHIYVGKAWRVVDIRLGPNIGSDHRPIIATLALR